jgi:hypothetical protein
MCSSLLKDGLPDSFPTFRAVPTFHVEIGPLFVFRRSARLTKVDRICLFLVAAGSQDHHNIRNMMLRLMMLHAQQLLL